MTTLQPLLFIALFFFVGECASVDSCVQDPSQAQCVNYELPGSVVNADVSDLCSQMPFMIGCSVDKLCEDSSIASDIYCARFSILKDLCLDMPKMSGIRIF
jgi:hypothetical protein